MGIDETQKLLVGRIGNGGHPLVNSSLKQRLPLQLDNFSEQRSLQENHIVGRDETSVKPGSFQGLLVNHSVHRGDSTHCLQGLKRSDERIV